MSDDPTQDFYRWDALGRPYTVCKVIDALYAWIGAQGITRLGRLGNEEHLRSPLPQDHTPFSYTARPLPLPGYVVTACDAANEVRNGITLGQGCLNEARAGRMPWLKYMNFDGMQYRYEDGFTVGQPNSDRHCHWSALTNHLNDDLDPGFNPFGDDMSWDEKIDYPDTPQRNPFGFAAGQILIGTNQAAFDGLNLLKALEEKVDKLLAKLESLEPGTPGVPGDGCDAVLDAMASAAEAAAGVLRDAAGPVE